MKNEGCWGKERGFVEMRRWGSEMGGGGRELKGVCHEIFDLQFFS